MVDLTQAHHDWVKDALNVDPQVFTTPDDDIEKELEDPSLLSKSQLVSFDTTGLFKDFSNTVHSACKRARAAMGDVYAIGAIGWNPSDAKGAAAVLAKSAPPLTKDQRAILESDMGNMQQAVHDLTREHDGLEAVADAYKAAAEQFNAMPEHIKDPAPLDSNFLDENGDVTEHVWDFINQITQITLQVADLHLIAGTDLIKDALKGDKMQKQIDALSSQLDTQRDTVNGMITATSDRAAKDAANALKDYGRKLDSLKEQMALTRGAIERYSKHLNSFATAKGKAKPDPEVEKVLNTYRAIIDAATSSKIARKALNTKTLGPGAYKTFVDQMIPLGKPITDDKNTGGASLFHKGGTLVKYTTTAAVTEALASGLEDVVAVYDDAGKIDQWFAAWSSAVGTPASN